MSIQIWSLTGRGQMMSHSTRNPRTSSWAIVHHLALTGSQTTEQLAEYCGISRGEAVAALVKLRQAGIVTDQMRVEV